MLIDFGGKLVNMAQVLWIEPAPQINGTPRSTIRFAGGGSLTVTGGLDWISQRQDRMIPAVAGYRAVIAWPQTDADAPEAVYFETLPVVAFRYRGDESTVIQPITVEGAPGDYYAIVGPDGQCWDVDRGYRSIDAYKQAFRDNWGDKRAPRTDGTTA